MIWIFPLIILIFPFLEMMVLIKAVIFIKILLIWCLKYTTVNYNINWKWEWKCWSLSCVQLFEIPWTVAHKAPLSMVFSRQEHWRGWPCPSPGDLPDPGIEPGSPTLKADPLPPEPPGKRITYITCICFSFHYWKWNINSNPVHTCVYIYIMLIKHDKWIM